MANNPTLLTRPLAEDGQKNVIPDTTDATSGLFSQQYGWQSINSLPLQAGGKAVKREDFNGAFNLLGGIAFMAQKGFTFRWSADQDYFAGCVVIDDTDGLRYECIADVTANNTAPSADTAHWQIFNSGGADIDIWFRQASTVYNNGAIALLLTLPTGWYLECTGTGGITSASDLVITSPTVGNTVTDGTVTWTIRKIGSSGDGVPLGAIIPLAHNSTLPAGYLECDGSAVSRTMYPDLFAAIGTIYGAGDGSTTFNLPDFNQAERFVQGSTVAGTVHSAGLPNIEGRVGRGIYPLSGTVTGAFTASKTSGGFDSGSGELYNYNFDASLSNPIYGASTTVQPKSLTCRFIIKAFDGQTADSALIDITQYAQELAGKADRDLNNLSVDGENHFLENDFTIIYPNGGSEANPANVTTNSRYVEANPFPGYYVNCVAEIKSGDTWGETGWIIYYSSGAGRGVKASNYEGDIVVQTGNGSLVASGANSGSPISPGVELSTAPCRVKVWKIGKIPTA